ncbi:unnamed protein product [Symbiodinium sp. CCMP2592]|nr:unnamed protein product [Symbiodinium sp. CCMP2592]
MLKKQSQAPTKSPCASQLDSAMLHVVWHGEPAVFSQMHVLGAGAYAKVLQVKHTITGAEYGMKVAKASGTNASLSEYDLYTQLQGHPHILQCFGAVTVSTNDGPRFGLCLEVASESLLDYLRREENQLATQVANGSGLSGRWALLWQAAQGLNWMHHKAVLHADLKPNNMLLFNGSLLKIADFGLSVRLDKAGLARVEADSVYARPYRPWELLEKQDKQDNLATVSAAADIYALGCCAYDLFTHASLILFPNCRDLGMALRGILPQKVEKLFGKARNLRCSEGWLADYERQFVHGTVCEAARRLSIAEIIDRCKLGMHKSRD